MGQEAPVTKECPKSPNKKHKWMPLASHNYLLKTERCAFCMQRRPR